MKVVYLAEARRDLEWMRFYYSRILPEGARQAGPRYRSTLALLRANPRMGHSTGGGNSLEFAVPRMPFSIIYRVDDTELVILRVWEERQQRPGR